MSDLTAEAIRLLGRQLHTATAAQLARAGVDEYARRRLLAEGVLERIGRSVYRTAGTKVSLPHRLVELSLEHPEGFVTGPTAGGYLGLRRMPLATEIVFTVPHGQRFEAPVGVRLQQSNRIDVGDTRTLGNGIVVASWPRLAFDLSRDLTPPNLRSVMDQMLQMKVLEEADLIEVARRLCASRRPGSRRFAHALLTRHGGRPVDSHPELVVLEGLIARGVPVVPQHDGLVLPNGRRVRIDLAVPQVQWAVEIDVHPAHLLLTGTTADKQRDRQLHLIGWQVERVTALDLLAPRALCDELATLYRARLGAHRPRN